MNTIHAGLNRLTVRPVTRLCVNRISRALVKGMMRDRVSVFMLHRLHDPDAGIQGHTVQFVTQAICALRKSGARVVPLREMVDRWKEGQRVDSNWIAFTIDDGFEDQGRLVEEAFLRMDCPVTVFLISGFLDGRLWPWDAQLAYAFTSARSGPASIQLHGSEVRLDFSSPTARRQSLHRVVDLFKQLDGTELYTLVHQIAKNLHVDIPADPPSSFRPMSWNRARELESLGAEFGAHSVSHRIFSHLSDSESLAELAECWQRLRCELRNPLPVMAWPTGRTGDFADKDINLARSVGMRACLATDSDYAHVPLGVESCLYSLRRFALPRDLTTVVRYGSWLERARQLVPI